MPPIEPARQRALLAAAPVARMATLRADGTPRLVPITFALLNDLICSVVDEIKPKRSSRLARLDDVRRDPRVGLIVDHYDADWARLWWVRVDGTASVHEGGALRERALDALSAKYPPYAASRPGGPVLVITPGTWTGWAASANEARLSAPGL